MAEKELEEIVLVRMISAKPRAVYNAWTIPALMQQWLVPEPNIVLTVTNKLEPGGVFNIEMQSQDGSKHFINGTYQSLIPYKLIAKSWCYSGPIEIIRGIDTLLEVSLIAKDEFLTELKLTQSRIGTTEACDAYRADWPSCLDKLQNFFLH